ncbi:MAG: M48 family metalloprotease [Pseudomonadota bacterium]
MSTQFFERQEVQRKYTRWLVAGFIAAILSVVVVINLVVLVGVGGNPMWVIRRNPEYLFWISLAVLVTILLACWHKASELRAGGAAVARSLGGVHVKPEDTDLARRRLVNIVEEMAIAARIRKPQVFVLPDEEGINAFAAGHSPDEAAVAVTQGALDRLDRDQLQAVIGHEFSHILNGDMKLNMRLTAWIFGLFVITDLARRCMRGRGRGKADARLKLVAFGIFAAGSIGMLTGRLLQAAVSRRREHLADASAVQFTRNPGALQGAFITMAAHQPGTRLTHGSSADVAHMFFAGSAPSWANKIGGSWFATHPPLEERVRAIDGRVTPNKFRTLVSDEKRKLAAKIAQANAEQAEAQVSNAAQAAAAAQAREAAKHKPAVVELPAAALAGLALAIGDDHSPAPRAAPTAPSMEKPNMTSEGSNSMTARRLSIAPDVEMAETLPSGVRMVAGRALPPDVLRNRLSAEQQAAIGAVVAQVEAAPIAVQATFVATMLAAEPAKWRTQLTRLAPVLGIELFKETQAQIARLSQLAPAARLPLLTDLLTLLDSLDPAERKRLRAVARAFAPTVATGDMLRFAVTRIIEKKMAKATEEAPPVPLPDRAGAVCDIYAALAQCRFGAGKQGQNSYRAGLMGMLPPQKWAPFPEVLLTPAALDAALAAVAQVHPTGKRSFSEGLARVIAVGGRLTVPQVDLLRAICLIVDCQVPLLPIDVVFEDTDFAPQSAQASAR